MLGIEIAKLLLIRLRLKLTSKPEHELGWPHGPHEKNAISLFSRSMVFKFLCALESSSGVVRTQIAESHPQSL